MSVSVEKLEKNMVKLTIEVAAEKVAEAEAKAYRKAKGKIVLPGFRKGKAPRNLIEKMYGPDVFMEDAVNEVLPYAYEDACKESGLEIVSRPVLDYIQVEHGKALIFTATVAVKPEVTLGEYKGLEVESEEVSVTEEEILAELAKEQEKNSVTKEVEDRPVADGDIVKLDFAGSVDGEAFEGGTATDYELTIGSHSFIDTFEEQMIGMSIGEEKDIHVTFPAEYHAENLAGKPAVFKVKVNAITEKVLPELDDEFAAEVSEFETLEAYKESISASLLEKKEKEAKSKKEDALLEKAVAGATMEIPDAMVESQAETMVQDFGQRLQQQGLTLEMYTKYTGQTVQQLVEQSKEQATKRIQGSLVLEAIAAAEQLDATEEEVDAELQQMADAYGMELDKVKSFYDEDSIAEMKKSIATKKALDFLYNNAK